MAEATDFTEVKIPNSPYYNGLDLPTIAYIKLGFIFGGDPKSIKEMAPDPDLDSSAIFEVKPNNLISFNFSRTVYGIGTFKISLWDRTWKNVEEALVKSNGRVQFQYGYREGFGGQKHLKSFPIGGRVFNYAVDFRLEGVIITMSGLAEGYVTNVVRKYAAWGSDDLKISDIVREIMAKVNKDDTQEKYTLVIEDTKPLKATPEYCEDFKKAESTFFSNNGDTCLSFITRQLAQYAVSALGNGSGYYAYVTRNVLTQKKEFHFHTPRYTPVNIDSMVPEPVFSMFQHGESPIISFSPSWLMSLVQIVGGGGEWSVGYDVTNRNTIITEISDIKKNDNGPNAGPDSGGGKENKIVPTLDSDNQFVQAYWNSAMTAAVSPDEAAAMAQNRTDVRKIGALTGTLKIIGNPNFNILSKIRVIVFIPELGEPGSNMSAEGKPLVHWISGSYLISHVEENIDRSGYTTTLSLMTDGRNFIEPHDKTNKEKQVALGTNTHPTVINVKNAQATKTGA